MTFPLIQSGLRMRSPILVAGLMIFAALAVTSRAQEEKKPAPPKISESLEKRLASLEKQIGELDQASRALQKQMAAIEAARDALKISAANLRAELGGAEPVKPGQNVKSPLKQGEPVDKAAREEGVRFLPFVIRVGLIILILGCAAYMMRIFVTRWNEEESEPPMVETETGLGTVRHPAEMPGIPDKVIPAAESGTKEPEPAQGEEDKSIEFKNPSEPSGTESSGKDYY